jgi:transposase
MAYIRGEAREQVTMFPVTLDELMPEDHMCRVIEAFVGRLDMAQLGFARAEPAETGRPGYDPRDLLRSCICTDICSRCGRRGDWKPNASATSK